MKSKTLTFALGIALLAALATPVQLAGQKQRYIVIDVGTLGGTFSQAYGINNKGTVVGFATVAGDVALHAFVWRKGVMTDLGTLAPTDTVPASGAYSINDNDEVVGFSETSVPDPQNTCGDSLVCVPVIWRDGTVNALPTLGGTDGSASSINNRGQVVGVAQAAEIDPTCQTPVIKPAVWEKGQVRALDTAPFLDGLIGDGPGPAGNNDNGQIVGTVATCDFSAASAYLWRKDEVVNIGTLGGADITPIAINNKGQATGTAFNGNLNRAFLWQDGVATDLGSLPNFPQVHGNSINNRSQITGQTCDITESFCTTFIWQSGVMTDLNTIVPPDSSLYMIDPSGINARGEIVGLAFQNTPNGFVCCHGFLAIPDSSVVGDSANAAQAEAPQHPQIIIPENIRKILEKQLGHRHHIPGL